MLPSNENGIRHSKLELQLQLPNRLLYIELWPIRTDEPSQNTE